MAKRKNPRQKAPVAPAKRPKRLPSEPSDDRIRLSFSIFDNYKWCEEYDDGSYFHVVAQKLRGYESMTWAEIQSRDHPVPLGSLIAPARQRLVVLQLDDADGALWRFQLDGLKRLWGIRDRSKFYVLWWDPEHLICPSKKKHT